MKEVNGTLGKQHMGPVSAWPRHIGNIREMHKAILAHVHSHVATSNEKQP